MKLMNVRARKRLFLVKKVRGSGKCRGKERKGKETDLTAKN